MRFTFDPNMVVQTRPPEGKQHFVRNVPALVITMNDESIIQVYEKDGYWEVWHMENDGTEKGYCLASSANPPQRHYDE